MEGFGDDEIESILYIGREVSGPLNHFRPLIAWLILRWKNLQNPETSDTDKASPHVPAGPKKDYSLKDGQTFSISIPGRAKVNHNSTSDLLGGGANGSSTSSGGFGVPLLPPPPPGAPRRR
ncbi:hypothetical protein PHLCEN_2v5845 [Hermanssonia centrifuga]|uniref:Uncharacterized protein n=1 Tax=Hermanssonia centrifuga TaxID=98765 RepID=A0A2R6P106_9APHY|nr:hypothetical protein PHLCEN_2v5845 [Hermanssonia centrifuga]